MKRAYEERARTLRVWRGHLALIHPSEDIHCVCELQPGRFRKGQRIGGCGQPRCYLCKRSKLLSRPTLQERRSDVSCREWLLELRRPPLRSVLGGRRIPGSDW